MSKSQKIEIIVVKRQKNKKNISLFGHKNENNIDRLNPHPDQKNNLDLVFL